MSAADIALAAVGERVAKRRAAWEVIEDDVIPDPVGLNETCIVGTMSLCALETRRRFIIKAACVVTPWSGADGRLWLETPTSLARDYLSAIYKKSPPVTHKQVLYLRAHTAPLPLWAVPCTFTDGYYLDIVSTYWTLMSAYGWNVDYWPGKWFAGGRPPADFPWPGHKLARNCLVSAGMSSRVQVYKPGAGYMNMKTGNHLTNLQLYCTIADTLNSVAREMVDRAGAVYVNTDGYILRDYASLTRALEVLREWHLPPHIKANGPGFVRGPGSYKFGPGAPGRRMAETPIAKIQEIPWAEWLKSRAVGLFERRDNETPTD